jgi:hypothetical protein
MHSQPLPIPNIPIVCDLELIEIFERLGLKREEMDFYKLLSIEVVKKGLEELLSLLIAFEAKDWTPQSEYLVTSFCTSAAAIINESILHNLKRQDEWDLANVCLNLIGDIQAALLNLRASISKLTNPITGQIYKQDGVHSFEM